MYFKKMIDIPSLPIDLKDDLVAEAIKVFNTKQHELLVYPDKRFELENVNCLNYIKKEEMEFYEKSGGVSVLAMSDRMRTRTVTFFKKVDHPATNIFNDYVYLFVQGGSFCAPHIDDVSRRREGLQLLLKAGGDAVKTIWYEPKEQFKELPIIDYCCIPYSKINSVSETSLEENYWYWMKFDSIHSIENLHSLRIFLVGIKNNALM